MPGKISPRLLAALRRGRPVLAECFSNAQVICTETECPICGDPVRTASGALFTYELRPHRAFSHYEWTEEHEWPEPVRKEAVLESCAVPHHCYVKFWAEHGCDPCSPEELGYIRSAENADLQNQMEDRDE